MSTGNLDHRTILRLAAEADVDPRSVARELRALSGADKHVRGRAGERIRQALKNASPEIVFQGDDHKGRR